MTPLSDNVSEPRESGSNRSALLAALVLLMAFILFRSFVHPTASRSDAELKQIDDSVTALASTKIAYAALVESKGNAHNRTLRGAEDAVVDEWETLARGNSAPPSAVRRLGITLFLFDRPWGLNAFKRLLTLKPLPPEKGKKPTPPLVPPAQEVACWTAIYGPKPLRKPQVPALRATLAKLKLNWFENLAAAALYTKAGMKPEADAARADALAATYALSAITGLQFLAVLFGMVCFVWLAVRFQSKVVQGNRFSPAFPANRLLSAFVIYLATFSFVTVPLLPLRPLFLRLHETTRDRLNVLITFAVYALIVALTVVVLRWLSRGEGRLSAREILARLGFRAHPFWTLVAGGLVAYALSRPFLIILAVVSDFLFHSFPTPPNPVIALVVSLQSPFDKILLLLDTALFAPIIEEMTFRGLLYPALRARWGVLVGVAASAAVFALAHPNLPGGFLPLWSLGVVLALVYEWRGSLLPGILLHGLHNGVVLLSFFAILARGT